MSAYQGERTMRTTLFWLATTALLALSAPPASPRIELRCDLPVVPLAVTADVGWTRVGPLVEFGLVASWKASWPCSTSPGEGPPSPGAVAAAVRLLGHVGGSVRLARCPHVPVVEAGEDVGC
jgi:hypothetical protein